MITGFNYYWKTKIVWHTLFDAYMEGDRLGAPFEGHGGAFSPFELSRRQGMYPKGTDESSIARCWLDFMDCGEAFVESNIKALAVRWCRFHMRHRSSTLYGSTWKEHFALVKLLESGNALTYDTLVDISRDKNSFGNGCLAMVLPAYSIVAHRGFPPSPTFPPADYDWIVLLLTSITHYHYEAQKACVALLRHFISQGQGMGWGEDLLMFRGPVQAGMTATATECLRAAVVCAHGAGSHEEIIDRASQIGGDVDSYLSLAFLLHKFDDVSETGAFYGAVTSETGS